MQKPLKMAWRGGFAHGKENTREVVVNSAKYNPDIIELDLRKSRDNVIFCYHGNSILAHFLKYLKFSTISKILSVETLEQILEVIIDKDVVIYCDIKQKDISAEDFNRIFNKFDFNKIWIATYSMKYLGNLRKVLDERFDFIYNFGFFRFGKGLKMAQKTGVKAIQMFFWQCKKNNLQEVEREGLEYIVCSFPIGQKRLIRLSNKLNPLFIRYADLEELK